MKTIKVILVSIVALSFAGCAAGSAQSRIATATAEIAALKAELEALKQTSAPAAAPAAPAPAPVAATPMAPPPGYVPSAHPPVRGGLPENFGWLYEKPAGCTDGPLSLEIVNQTGLYVRVLVDGKGVETRGAYGVLPHLPPGQTVYVCLDRVGRHNVSGVVYARRYSQLVEVSRFSENHNYNRLDTHHFFIDSSTFNY